MINANKARLIVNIMADITMVEGGVCAKCGHNQKDHEGNTTCDIEGCDCVVKGSF